MESNKYLFSRIIDPLLFLGPLFLAFFLEQSSTLLLLPPLLVFILIVVTFDVAHVWASFSRNYMDGQELRRRPILYFLPIPLCLISSTLIHWYSPSLFWTIVAYLAIVHFIRQPYGFLAIYKFKNKEYFDRRLDHIFIWVCALGPLLAWHANAKRQFDWFGHGEQFLIKIPASYEPWIWLFYSIFLSYYLIIQILRIRVYGVNPGKVIIQFSTLVTWKLGLASNNPMISAAYINLFHGIPFLAITWLYLSKKWSQGQESNTNSLSTKILIFLVQKKTWFLFLFLCFIPALLEEALWEGLVWHNLLPPFFSNIQLNTFEVSLIVAILSLPQIVHYILDAFIWKLNDSNPDLKKNLGLA